MTALGVGTAVAAIGSSLVGGVFFAFSGFIMPAFRRLPAMSGVAAMQSINVAALSAPLMAALFGTAAVAVVVPVLAWRSHGDHLVLGLLLLAGILYLFGVVGVTAGVNVPLNNQLAAASASTMTDDGWLRWVAAWTIPNHIRMASALLAATCYTVALARRAA